MKPTRPCLCYNICDMARSEFLITFRDQGVFAGAPAILCGFLLFGRPFLVAFAKHRAPHCLHQKSCTWGKAETNLIRIDCLQSIA